MKTKLLFSALFLLTLPLLAVDSITFTESSADKVVTFRDYGETFHDVATTYNGSFRATLTLPGTLGAVNDDTPFNVTIGNFSWGGSLGDGRRAGNTYTFVDAFEDEDTGRTREFARLVITRNGNQLMLTGTLKDEAFSITADEPDEDGKINGETQADVSLGDFEFFRRLYYKGTGSMKIQRVGRGDYAEEFELFSSQVSGGADFGKPTVSITTPKNKTRTTNESVLVQGRASDNVSVDEVLYRVGTGAWLPADGTGNWSIDLPLAPGNSLFSAKSIDQDGNESTVATRTFTRVVMSTLVVNINGSGTTKPVLNGALLEVGKSYKLKAVPNRGNVFVNWTGGVNTNKASITFTMQPGLVLNANFAPAQ